jgi:KaiC/GvpD/RAD55 family RecA-like ATPase
MTVASSPASKNGRGIRAEDLAALAPSDGLFKVRTGNQWLSLAKEKPIPQMLCDQLWHQNEVAILFAPSGVGKSILAMQIADSVSRGRHILYDDAGEPKLYCQTAAQKVLYIDCELSEKQFENRYSNNYTDHYSFSRNFLRAELDTDALSLNDAQIVSESFIKESLEKAVANSGAKVLVMDNITYLRNETEKAKDALPLMKHMKSFAKTYGLSILAIAHTPKRDPTKPLTENDLQGSSMLTNFCDAMFAIGASGTDKSLRYIKQLKARANEKRFTAENVVVCRIAKPKNFVGFQFIEFGNENDHLRHYDQKDKAQLIQSAKEMYGAGKSQREIANELGKSVGTINAYLKS